MKPIAAVQGWRFLAGALTLGLLAGAGSAEAQDLQAVSQEALAEAYGCYGRQSGIYAVLMMRVDDRMAASTEDQDTARSMAAEMITDQSPMADTLEDFDAILDYLEEHADGLNHEAARAVYDRAVAPFDALIEDTPQARLALLEAEGFEPAMSASCQSRFEELGAVVRADIASTEESEVPF
ncbi:hypothetical protein [Pelagibacterium montanilacus]|uniref:hypothetical protein n=1 Tax=Pelagibacterium montanilacus TaxID=2185280 RepID=UPI000F8DEC84|nr:hypothetical protein [Pelagibacterium montanilacus]